MKKTIFYRTLAITALAIVIVFVAGVFLAYNNGRSIVEKRLVAETELLKSFLEKEDNPALFLSQSEKPSIRVTLIKTDGRVLYDSDTSEELESHLDREEVRSALEGKPQAVRRYSATLGYYMTYYADTFSTADGDMLIIRLAAKSSEISSYIISSIPLLLLVLIISAAVAGLFSVRMSRHFTESVSEISDCLKGVNEGTYVPLPVQTRDTEIQYIYTQINAINEKTVAYIKSIEAERELAKQKEEFFANASHELKTPLTTMLGLTELAMMNAEDEGTKKRIGRIHKESLRLSGLISDMLKLSRLENLPSPEIYESISVREVAEEVLTELAEQIAERDIDARIEGNCRVRASDKHVYEILENLCSNAINYNKPGGRLDVTLSESSGRSVICVRDTGIGIAEENIPHLCERFYRVDKSRSKKTGGTGLGLAIVKHAAALYHADISISSKIGEGTEITVTFREP